MNDNYNILYIYKYRRVWCVINDLKSKLFIVTKIVIKIGSSNEYQ